MSCFRQLTLANILFTQSCMPSRTWQRKTGQQAPEGTHGSEPSGSDGSRYVAGGNGSVDKTSAGVTSICISGSSITTFLILEAAAAAAAVAAKPKMNYFAALQGSDPETERDELAAREEQRRAASAASNGSITAAVRRQRGQGEWQGPGLKQPLVWIDCEMTGLDVERDSLLQIAVICTGGRVGGSCREAWLARAPYAAWKQPAKAWMHEGQALQRPCALQQDGNGCVAFPFACGCGSQRWHAFVSPGLKEWGAELVPGSPPVSQSPFPAHTCLQIVPAAQARLALCAPQHAAETAPHRRTLPCRWVAGAR